ncbi:unnamed protein product [Prunus armeniaca]|uniref:Uncharacterized protein n=1 Tax=Prunus armeniaca TaxID=36596 RepID=A0A6J5TYJ8_PRUAR|nr:unnamed protein product [Prunus armeniaca]
MQDVQVKTKEANHYFNLMGSSRGSLSRRQDTPYTYRSLMTAPVMAPKPSELAGVDSSSAHSVKAPLTCLTVRQIKIIEPTDSILSNCSNLSKQLSTCVCKGTK